MRILTPAGVPDSHYTVGKIRISTVGPSYSRAFVIPAPRYRRSLQGAVAILKRTHGVWRVTAIGTSELACGIRRAIRRDLGVDYCP